MRLLALVLLLAGTAACGGDSSTSPTTPTPAPVTTASIAGNYSVNFRTSATCPQQINRTWGSTITQSGPSASVNILGSAIILPGPFNCTVSGNQVSCPPANEMATGGMVGLVENLDLSISVQIHATASGSTISGTMTGQMGHLGGSMCNASDHAVTFTKQ